MVKLPGTLIDTLASAFFNLRWFMRLDRGDFERERLGTG